MGRYPRLVFILYSVQAIMEKHSAPAGTFNSLPMSPAQMPMASVGRHSRSVLLRFAGFAAVFAGPSPPSAARRLCSTMPSIVGVSSTTANRRIICTEVTTAAFAPISMAVSVISVMPPGALANSAVVISTPPRRASTTPHTTL